jgi:predicted transcriptional regulator of viral defense system
MARRRKPPARSALDTARGIFRRNRGMLPTRKALDLGIHPRTLYRLRDEGMLEPMGRGLYRLAEMPALEHPDLVTVALKVPVGVVCLISALSFHDLTTEIPHEVHIALPRGAERPRTTYPPLRVFWFGGPAHTDGVETHKLDGVAVRVYCAEKTLADIFKFRTRVGMDTVVESLRLYAERRRPKVEEILKFARVCRVERVIRPYLEAIL